MHTIVWWGVWGLVVSAGLVGLLENAPHHLHLLLALPILTAAMAAALIRLNYEYHQAIQHAKRLVISSLVLMTGLGCLYVKARALGPFATGTTQKAFLGTTFGMSLPETERALGRRLHEDQEEDKPLQERAQDWLLEALPLPGHPVETSFAMPLTLYRVPCKTIFAYKKGKLARVELEFDTLPTHAAELLVGKIRAELEKDYRPMPDAAGHKPAFPLVFEKESAESKIEIFRTDPHYLRVRVTLQYLPFMDAPAPALSVEANVF
jgi:hypothetical protein